MYTCERHAHTLNAVQRTFFPLLELLVVTRVCFVGGERTLNTPSEMRQRQDACIASRLSHDDVPLNTLNSNHLNPTLREYNEKKVDSPVS